MFTLPIKKNQRRRRGVTLLLVLALMVMFAMLVTTFMVIVLLNRRNADLYAGILLQEPPEVRISGIAGSGSVQENGVLDTAFQLLLTGGLDTVIGPHSILENLYGHGSDGRPFGGTGADYDEQSTSDALLSLSDESGKPFALRPNILAPNVNGIQEYKKYLEENSDVQMNPDYTAPDYSSMFLAWNDVSDRGLERIIPAFHRPQLVKYWNDDDPNELRKYVLRPLPTDHPEFTGSNPAAVMSNLKKFLTAGPWDADCDGDGKADSVWLDIGLPSRQDSAGKWYKPLVAFHVIDMDGRINVNAFGNLVKDDTILGIKGMGLGVAELSSGLIPKKLMEERYGSNGKPGGIDDDLRNKNGINLDAYEKGGLATDWSGTVPIEFDELGNRKKGTPVPQEDIPYLMNPYNDTSGDKPFRENDLETLLRSVIDLDYNRLPLQLRELLDDQFDPQAPALTSPHLRYNFTTRSSDIPVAAPLYGHVRSLYGDKADEWWKLLPEEIRRGEKVNLNRLTLRDDWMTGGNDLLKAKAQFAQEIFYLLQVLLPEKEHNTERSLERLAQWAVNLVDFIDPDDVMTPFIFKTDGIPEDCTGMISDLCAGTLSLPSNCALIWGFEKPEVALTKTFAVHDRKVEHRLNGDYQVERPQGSLFVQLYRQGNQQRSYAASCLVESDGTLNLAKKTSSDDYIWRLAVGEATKTTAGRFEWNDDDAPGKNALRQLLTPENGAVKYPQFNQWSSGTSEGQYHPDLGIPERYVWFGNSFPTADNEVRRRSFVNRGEADVDLNSDSFLVIAPRQITDFDSLGSIDLTNTKTMIATNPNVAAVTNAENPVVGSGIVEVNVSEPLPTLQLTDGYVKMPGTNVSPPFDNGLNGTVPAQRGTVACYKTICLQRLADPTRPYHAISNPYVTVDWNMIDLQVINTLDPENKEGVSEDDDMRFVPRRWREETASGFFHLWDRTLTESVFTDDKAGLEKNLGLNTFDDSPRAANKSLLHFPWHDAPLMNTGELMLVPASASGRFGVEFHDNGTDTNFFGGKQRFGYHGGGFSFNLYLNWADHLAGTLTEMPRLFEFVHVPSRFTDAVVNKREPAKINLNTVTKEGWNALQNGRNNFPSYEDFHAYRESKQNDFSGAAGNVLLFDAVMDVSPSLIDNTAINPYTALENVMRLSDVTTTRSNVFAVWTTVGYFNVEKFDDFDALQGKYPALTHINSADMFKAVYPDGCVLGVEKGLDDGTVKRYRAFYLIDRSIPVDFSRGNVQDMDKVILNPARTQLD